MSGRSTRKMYDVCATQQDVKQSTDPLELQLDVTKYVHANNICKPTSFNHQNNNVMQLVDIESSLRGIDKIASKCDTTKHPFCSNSGCLLTNDHRVGPHITPYACEWGHAGDNAVTTTNMQMPMHPGFNVPNVQPNTTNGYYSNQNQKGKHFVIVK